MKQIILLVLVAWSALHTDAAACENGWTAYKDELCITHSSSQVSYDDAKQICTSYGEDATLVIVKDAALQDFLSNYTLEIYNTLWLGGKYDNESGQFIWEDGEAFEYTNWADGYPHNNTEVETCIELRPPLSKAPQVSEGKWADVPCLKQNWVLCQKPLEWTFKDAVEEIKRMRKQYDEEIARIMSRVVPIGSIYVEYANQPSPTSLWPELVWEDVTSSYEGLFFRALGGGSEPWLAEQSECAPRIARIGFSAVTNTNSSLYPPEVAVPEQGWSPWVKAGELWYNSGTKAQEALRLHSENCEVRPRNQAIRIWRRTG